MASGYFPLEYDNAKKLVAAAKLIDEVATEQRDLACQDLTPEDAASDGACIGELRLAIELILRNIADSKGDSSK